MRSLSMYPIMLSLIAVATLGGCAAVADDQQNTPVARAATAKSPDYTSYVLPAGTQFVAVLSDRLATDVNVSGDTFRATTVEPIVVDGTTVIPAGATVTGALRDVQASGRVKGRARMTLTYDSIRSPLGAPHSITAQPLTLQAASETSSDIEKIAAGTVLGAVIGGVVGDGKGAIIGAGVGAGAGTILMLATKGDDLELNAGQRLLVLMTNSTSVRVLANN